jgi:hypothetical protein
LAAPATHSAAIFQIDGRCTPGLDAHTTRHDNYCLSQKRRKRVEEIFGWMKSWGGLRRTRSHKMPRDNLPSAPSALAPWLDISLRKIVRPPQLRYRGRPPFRQRISHHE